MEEQKVQHIPVLLDKVLEVLDIQDNDVVVDGTLGLGGHAKQILIKLGQNGKLVAFDLDNRNLQEARRRLKRFEGRVLFVNDSYDKIDHYSKVLKFGTYNKVLLDLGVSSPHFDNPEYGFSFQKNGPLDMRFNKEGRVTASLILNKLPEEKLVEIFSNFGEVPISKRLAKRIVEERVKEPFLYTLDFVARIENLIPFKDKQKILACIFQALRIATNDELNVLQAGLKRIFKGMARGGRMAVISYHSLEDRIVKDFFNNLLRPLETSPEKALKSIHGDPKVEILTKKVVLPTPNEAATNPRARSAKLRAVIKL